MNEKNLKYITAFMAFVAVLTVAIPTYSNAVAQMDTAPPGGMEQTPPPMDAGNQTSSDDDGSPDDDGTDDAD